MRPRFQWDLYDQVYYDLGFLSNTPYKNILQLVGCHREGMSLQQIIDNCKSKFISPRLMEEAINDLCAQGFMSTHTVQTELMGGHIANREYYRVNWRVIKQYNNYLKRLP